MSGDLSSGSGGGFSNTATKFLAIVATAGGAVATIAAVTNPVGGAIAAGVALAGAAVVAKKAYDSLPGDEQEEAEKAAKAKAEREAAEKAAKEKAEREAAEKAAKEKAEREAAEKAAKEKAEREAAEKAAKEKAEREAAEKAAKEKAEREAAEKAAKEKAEREAAEKAAKEKAEREAAEKAAKEKAEREAAEKAAKEKAEREAAEKAAKEKAEREAAEKAAKEKAEREAAEKAAKEKAEREAAEKAAIEQAEREAAEKAAKKEAERRANLPPHEANPGPFESVLTGKKSGDPMYRLQFPKNVQYLNGRAIKVLNTDKFPNLIEHDKVVFKIVGQESAQVYQAEIISAVAKMPPDLSDQIKQDLSSMTITVRPHATIFHSFVRNGTEGVAYTKQQIIDHLKSYNGQVRAVFSQSNRPVWDYRCDAPDVGDNRTRDWFLILVYDPTQPNEVIVIHGGPG